MAIIRSGQSLQRPQQTWQQSGSGWRYALSTRDDGNMSFRYGREEDVRENRRRFFSRLGAMPNVVVPLSLDISHGVHWLEQQPEGIDAESRDGFQSEGVWTTNRQQNLFLFVGDCFPLGFFDQRRGALGVFHAGRHELQAGLLEQFLNLGKSHGVSMKHLNVFVGPGICSAHYVFKELPSMYWGAVIQDASNMYHLDLRSDIDKIFLKVGIEPDQVIYDQRCTYEAPELFSHRREQGTNEGRFGLLTQVYG